MRAQQSDITACCQNSLLILGLERQSVHRDLSELDHASILGEAGCTEILLSAANHVSSVTCEACGAILSQRRLEVHQSLWCTEAANILEREAMELD